VLKADSVGFYLANYLQPDSANNYVVKTWEWFDLLPLGKVDSLVFTLSSTDNGSFGMNTPSYFCMDDFTTYETFDTTTPPTSVAANSAAVIKMYPNPATNRLYIDVADNSASSIWISDLRGNIVTNVAAAAQHNEINISSLPAGVYLVQVNSNDKKAVMRFVKQ
jgi:hypothetical protein